MAFRSFCTVGAISRDHDVLVGCMFDVLNLNTLRCPGSKALEATRYNPRSSESIPRGDVRGDVRCIDWAERARLR